MRQPELVYGAPHDLAGGLMGQYKVPVAAPTQDDNYLAFMQAITNKEILEQYLPDAEGVSNEPLRKALLDVGAGSLVERKQLADIAQRKAEEARQHDYQAFVASHFDLTDPYQIKQYNKIQPQMLNMRRKQVENAFAVSGKLHAMNLVGGAQNDADFRFLWALHNGDIQTAEELFPNGIPGYDKNRQAKGNYKKGMFAPMNTLESDPKDQKTAMRQLRHVYPTSQKPYYNSTQNFGQAARKAGAVWGGVGAESVATYGPNESQKLPGTW